SNPRITAIGKRRGHLLLIRPLRRTEVPRRMPLREDSRSPGCHRALYPPSRGGPDGADGRAANRSREAAESIPRTALREGITQRGSDRQHQLTLAQMAKFSPADPLADLPRWLLPPALAVEPRSKAN